jgi:hypothetical protein
LIEAFLIGKSDFNNTRLKTQLPNDGLDLRWQPWKRVECWKGRRRRWPTSATTSSLLGAGHDDGAWELPGILEKIPALI